MLLSENLDSENWAYCVSFWVSEWVCYVAEMSLAAARCIGKARWKERGETLLKWTYCSQESWAAWMGCSGDSWSMGCPRRWLSMTRWRRWRKLHELERNRCHQATHVSNKYQNKKRKTPANRARRRPRPTFWMKPQEISSSTILRPKRLRYAKNHKNSPATRPQDFSQKVPHLLLRHCNLKSLHSKCKYKSKSY